MTSAIWPERVRILRMRESSVRIDRRAMTVASILALALGILMLVAVTLGDTEIPVPNVLAALFGAGDDGIVQVVRDWRVPRILLAAAGGASLALSGAIFQSLTRNPLGSPDIIGFSTGAYTGGLVVSLVLGASTLFIPVGAFLGGLATAAVVYVFAFRRGVQGFRLIVVGIAVSAVLGAVNAYILVRGSLEQSVSAAIWGAGSMNGARWGDVVPVLVTLAVMVPACMLLSRRLSALELGDEHAVMLGVRADATRVLLILVGVALVAVVTATTGPITFVALAAPQIAKRIVRGTGPQLAASALVGAVLLLASDVIAQRIIAPSQYPVGVVTACLGGAYLVWLLARGMEEHV